MRVYQYVVLFVFSIVLILSGSPPVASATTTQQIADEKVSAQEKNIHTRSFDTTKTSVLSTETFAPNVLSVTVPSEFIETTIILTPENSKDIWTTSKFAYGGISSSPGGGLDNGILVVGGWGDSYHSLLRFNLAGLPTTDVVSVRLDLYSTKQRGATNTPMHLDRVTKSWDWWLQGTGRDRERLWWADRPTAVQVATLPSPAQNAWYSIDITDLYRQWQDATFPNYGIQLRPVTTSNTWNEFFSSNYMENSALLPRLVIKTIRPPDPCATPGVCASNVLFLPGIEASRLYRESESGGEKKLWEPDGDATASLLALDTSGTSIDKSIYTKEGDIIDNAYVPVKGNVYKSFIDEMNNLVAAGTVKEWKAIPYDWRLSFDQILKNGSKIAPDKISYLTATSSPYLIQELRRLAKNSKTKKVTIVAHSNGGLLAKALTNELGAEAATLIDKMIFVAVPQVGTPQAIGALLHGYDQGLPIKMLSFAGISEATARSLALNMPSIYNLLPSGNYFTYTDEPVITISDDPLLAPWRAAYGGAIHSGAQLRTFLTDASRPPLPTTNPLVSPALGNGALLTKSDVVHASLDSWAPPTGITLTEVAGWGEETLSTIHYYQGLASQCTARKADSTCAAFITSPVLQYAPKTVLDGDGTVVVPSALWNPSAKRYWVDLQKYNDGLIGKNIDRKHADILEISELRTFVQNIITNKATSTAFDIVSATQPSNPNPATRLHFTLHSPLSLHLYDEFGNHTGISTSTNSLEENIPGSRYLSFGEVQYVSTPASANLRLVMDGYAEGSFTLDLAEVAGGVTLASTTFAGIPSSPGTVATMDIPVGDIASASPLMVDENGDGKVDLTLAPEIGGVVLPRMSVTVAARDTKMILGDTIPPLLYTISDALGSAVAEGDISGAPDCATTATPVSTVGDYQITCTLGTLVSEKYKFTTFTPGTLSVQYRWDGFLQPVANKNVFKQGSTIPVKFQLKRFDGSSVQAARAPEWLDPLSGASSAVYRWDDTAEQYIYNWSTKGFTTGAYRISAKLDDGTMHYTIVNLK